MKPGPETTKSALLISLLHHALLACIVLSFAGCSVIGSDEPEASGDVCENVFHRFVSDDDGGPVVSSSQCEASDRGEWTDGRCYCHGAEE